MGPWGGDTCRSGPVTEHIVCLEAVGELVDLHIDDMCAVEKPPRRSKAATLTTLKNDLGNERIGHIDRAMLIE